MSEEALPTVVIQPSEGWVSLKLRELWQYRELLYFLTWRDVQVRYRQTALGILWAVLQPLLTMAIFSVVFGRLANLPSDGLPYPIFVFAALLPWQLFSGALTRAGTSLVSSANLLTKVYFPRLIIPFSAVAAGLVDFAIALAVLVVLMLYYGIRPGLAVLWIPVLVIFALASALAVGLWLSALNVKYRDVQHLIPFLVMAWMYASPVAYSANMIPGGRWRLIYALNPMAGVIQGFRWALTGGPAPSELILVSAVVVVVMLVGGLYYFRRMERGFADIV
ncbi:MAG: ABC transporter permease [Gemmatimonadaceae bacterium]|nr:ABC transporter permease [Gemmatimonadaceae bacterium]